MAGTQIGGRKAAATNKERYGEDFYERSGRAGGKKSRGGAFSKDRDFASAMGKIGGKVSKRDKRRRRVAA